MVKQLTFILLLLLAFAGQTQAQVIGNDRVSSSISQKQIGLDQTATFTISIKGRNDVIDLPEPTTRGEGLQLMSIGRQVSISSINGSFDQVTKFNYLVTPIKKGRFVIDSVSIDVNGVVYKTESHRVEVTDSVGYSQPQNPYSRWNTPRSRPATPTIPQLNPLNQPQPTGQDVILESTLEPEVVYKHQPTVYNLRLLSAVRLRRDPRYSPIAPTGFVSVGFEQENSQEYRNGRGYAVTEAKTAFYPVTVGEYTFPSSEIEISTGFFGRSQRLATRPKVLKVLPLPLEGQPESFTGAVGEEFEIQASLNQSEVKLGETVELKVRVEGDGHLDLVPYPFIPEQAEFERRQIDGSSDVLTEGTKVTSFRNYIFRLKTKKAGDFELKNIALAYFRPSQERYEVVKAPTLHLTVLPNTDGTDETQGMEVEQSLSEDNQPQPKPGGKEKLSFHLSLETLLLPLGVALFGLAMALLGTRLPKWGNPLNSGRKGSIKNPKNLNELEQAMLGLAQSSDSILRAQELADVGWSSNAIERFEGLRAKLSAQRYSKSSKADSEQALLNDFRDLLKEVKKK